MGKTVMTILLNISQHDTARRSMQILTCGRQGDFAILIYQNIGAPPIPARVVEVGAGRDDSLTFIG